MTEWPSFRNIANGDICIESVPPEDFFVDRNARTLKIFMCVTLQKFVFLTSLAMGFSLDDLSGLTRIFCY